jgi:Flp pilus assembly protein TadG
VIGARARRIGRDERGVSVIEMAFVAPVLAIFIVGVVDIGRGFSAKLTLEEAAYRTLEKVAVGTVQTDYTYLKAEAATAAGVPQANVTVDSWLECDGTRQASFAGECTGTQQTARYVKVTITNNFKPSFPYGKWVLKSDASGNVALSAVSSLRVQ